MKTILLLILSAISFQAMAQYEDDVATSNSMRYPVDIGDHPDHLPGTISASGQYRCPSGWGYYLGWDNQCYIASRFSSFPAPRTIEGVYYCPDGYGHRLSWNHNCYNPKAFKSNYPASITEDGQLFCNSGFTLGDDKNCYKDRRSRTETTRDPVTQEASLVEAVQ